MVSEAEQKLKQYSKNDYEFLAEPIYIRLKFKKTGKMQFISHLDLQKSMGRILIRAKAPLWYSKGFNPHPKLIFATPLSVGCESITEYLDVRVERNISPDVLMEHLNAELTDEMSVIDAYIGGKDFTEIMWAEYDFEVKTNGANEQLALDIEKLLTTSPCIVSKRTKSGNKDVDIVPLMKNVKVEFVDGIIKINCLVSINGANYLNPEIIITTLKDRLSILSTSLVDENYKILRKKLFLDDMKTEFR